MQGGVTDPCHRRRVGGDVPAEPVRPAREVRGLDGGSGLLPGLTRSHAVCGHDLPEALARWLGFRGGRVRPGCGRWPQNLLGLVEEPGDGGGRGPVFSGLLPARVGRARRSSRIWILSPTGAWTRRGGCLLRCG